jgi:dTDP-4-amino-4,6-dideoxygalactose transaminase
MREEFIIPKEPRLNWKTLLPSFRRDASFFSPDEKAIYHLFWARNGIYHGLAALGVKPGENVLVPAYHCKSSVEPIVQGGGGVKFYDTSIDLNPDFSDIKKQIDHKTRAILAVHYFGFPQPIQKFRQLCDAHNLFLIEDCAHVLTGRTPDGTLLGETGDISVFSWRKFFPIPDGGQLVINNANAKCKIKFEKGDFLFRLKIAKNTFDALLEPSKVGQCVAAVLGLSSKVIRKWMLLNRDGAKTLKVNSYDPDFDLAAVNLQMTALSKRILRRSDISAVMKRRRDNYIRLTDAVRKMAGVAPLFTFLPEEICPWVFPLVVHEIGDLQMILRAKGIPVTSWGGVIHQALPLEKFPNARFLYKNLLFLPIHQNLESKDLRTMVGILRETLNEKVRLDQSRKSFGSIDVKSSPLLPTIR